MEGAGMKPELIWRVADEDSFKYCFGINIAFDKTGFIFEAMFFLWDFQFNWLKGNFYKEQERFRSTHQRDG
jgi:hypothetical protein